MIYMAPHLSRVYEGFRRLLALDRSGGVGWWRIGVDLNYDLFLDLEEGPLHRPFEINCHLKPQADNLAATGWYPTFNNYPTLSSNAIPSAGV